jgi:hypothetical protein
LNTDDNDSFSGDGSWRTTKSESLTGRSTQANDGSTMTLGNSVMTLGNLKPIPETGSPPRLEDAVGTLDQERRTDISWEGFEDTGELQRTIDYESQITLAPIESLTIGQTNDSSRHDSNDVLRLDSNDSIGVLAEWTSSMVAEFDHLFEEEGEGSSEMQIRRKEETASGFLGINGQGGGDQQQGTRHQSIEMPDLDLDNEEPVINRSESPHHPFLQFLGQVKQTYRHCLLPIRPSLTTIMITTTDRK